MGMLEQALFERDRNGYATEKSPDGINVLTLTAAMSIATKMGLLTTGADAKLTTNTNVKIQAFNIDTSAGRTGMPSNGSLRTGNSKDRPMTFANS